MPEIVGNRGSTLGPIDLVDSAEIHWGVTQTVHHARFLPRADVTSQHEQIDRAYEMLGIGRDEMRIKRENRDQIKGGTGEA